MVNDLNRLSALLVHNVVSFLGCHVYQLVVPIFKNACKLKYSYINAEVY